jgi:hypothetical protein
LRDAGFTISDVAIKLGYTHPRIFAHHIESVLGECPSKVRRSLADDDAVVRIVSWFGSSARSTGRLLKHHAARAVCLLTLLDWAWDLGGFLDFS